MITSYCSSYFSYSLKCVKATMITKSSTLPFMKLHWSRIRLLHSQAFTECLLCTRRHAGQWGDVWTERVELQFFSVFSHTYINAFLTTKYNYYRNYCFSLCFQELSLSLVYRSLNMVCLGVNFFRFILFGVHATSWICKLMSSAKFGEFSAINSLSTISFLVFLFVCVFCFTFWDSSDMNVRLFAS